jgi:hypothetical protein
MNYFLAKLSMLLGLVGCFGAWFEKKALLFIVIKPFSSFFRLIKSFSY